MQPQLIDLHNQIKDEKDEKIEPAIVEPEIISSEEEKITTERLGLNQYLPLRSKKAGIFEKLLGFARSHCIETHPSCFSKS